ncbi:hypothetical protein FRC03_004244 [Tulasnella sp. 419]|nr:hypothetical protein FRC03_004244 [Tulasnella sp. 419]
MYPKPRLDLSDFGTNQNQRRGGGGAGKTQNGRASSGQNRKNNKRAKYGAGNPHWDSLGNGNEDDAGLDYGGDGTSVVSSKAVIVETRTIVPEVEEEVLTHDQIWDDSALVEAWDAAMEEYRMIHGPDKDWKTEPVYKNSLWYMEPKPQSTANQEGTNDMDVAQETEEGEDEEQYYGEPGDSEEVELELNNKTNSYDVAYAGAFEALPDTSKFTPEQLFQKAMEASYWAGYWASAYKQSQQTSTSRV